MTNLYLVGNFSGKTNKIEKHIETTKKHTQTHKRKTES